MTKREQDADTHAHTKTSATTIKPPSRPSSRPSSQASSRSSTPRPSSSPPTDSSESSDELLAQLPPLPVESEEERNYEPKLEDLDPGTLSVTEKKLIVSIVACCLPKSGESWAIHPTLSNVVDNNATISSSSSSSAPNPLSPSSRARIELGLDESTLGTPNPSFSPTTFELSYLLKLLEYFQLDRSMLVSLQPLLGRGVEPSAFLEELHWTTLNQRMRFLLLLLNFSILTLSGYDSRVRSLIRTLCHPSLLHIHWNCFCRLERQYAYLVASDLERHMRKKSTPAERAKKWVKVGLVGAAAGTALFFTAGLAAPAIGAGFAALGIAGTAAGAAFLASSAGAIVLGSVFGGVGAGLLGFKSHRRFSGLSEFLFEKISRNQDSMNVCLTIVGWLNEKDDCHKVWSALVAGREIVSQIDPSPDSDHPSSSSSSSASAAAASSDAKSERDTKEQRNKKDKKKEKESKDKQLDEKALRARMSSLLNRSKTSDSSSSSASSSSSGNHSQGLAEFSEVYTLRWESSHLLRLGQGLQVVTKQDVVTSVASQGLQRTALNGLMMGLMWPVTLLQAGDLVDHPWLVVLNRCDKAAIELANALESRVAGRRPITLIAYSMGARVVFLALEELARRKDVRRRAREQKEREQAMKKQKSTTSKRQESSSSRSQADTTAVDPAKKKESVFDRMFSSKKSKKEPSQSQTSSSSSPAPSPSSSPVPSPVDSPSSSSSSSSSSPDSDVDLSADDGDGVVLDVFLFGTPAPTDIDRWRRVRSMVAGRLVNVYTTRDWVLRFIYPLSNLTINVAGLMPIKHRATDALMKRATPDNPEVFDQPPNAANSEERAAASSSHHGAAGKPGVVLDMHEDEVDETKKQELEAALAGPLKKEAEAQAQADSKPEATFTQLQLPKAEVYEGIENYDVTQFVTGHREYPHKMEFLLRLCEYQA